MDVLIKNQDVLLYLLKYIQKYNYFNLCENEDNDSFIILYYLSHCCKGIREIIIDKKNNFPKIKYLMFYYKKNIILPNLKNELIELNNRKILLENQIYILPIQLDLIQSDFTDRKIIYINYKNKIIHHKDCNYSYSYNEFFPEDTKNLESMKKYFKQIDFKNEDNINNFISFKDYIKYYYILMNFKICNNSINCKCLHNKIQNYFRDINK